MKRLLASLVLGGVFLGVGSAQAAPPPFRPIPFPGLPPQQRQDLITQPPLITFPQPIDLVPQPLPVLPQNLFPQPVPIQPIPLPVQPAPLLPPY